MPWVRVTREVPGGWLGAYKGVSKLGYNQFPIPARGDHTKTEAYLPMIHLVFSNLKTWLKGIHHGVSQQHLQAYLNKFTFRLNRRFYLFNAFRSLLGIAGDVHAPTYSDLYSGRWLHPSFPAEFLLRPEITCRLNWGAARRETNSWRWPLFQVAYMTALAWGGSFAVFQIGRLIGF